MATSLHQSVSPRQLAERSQAIEYNGKIEEFGRLSEIAAAERAATGDAPGPEAWQAAPVAIRLQFAWADDARREVPLVKGHAAVDMPAICQRCLEPFRYPLANDISVAIVDARYEQQELADDLGIEIWELEQDNLRLIDLVEESLIMAMPLAPMHGADHPCGRVAEVKREADEDTGRPFADLKAHMNKTKQ